MNIKIPKLDRWVDISNETFYPYTAADMAKVLPRIAGRKLSVGFEPGTDGPEAAARMIREKLGPFGVVWEALPSSSEGYVWVQTSNADLRFIFVVADPNDRIQTVSGECGPQELLDTMASAICEYLLGAKETKSDSELAQLLQQVAMTNRALMVEFGLAHDEFKAKQSINKLTHCITQLAHFRGPDVEKCIRDAIADSRQAFSATGWIEAKNLHDAAVEALRLVRLSVGS